MCQILKSEQFMGVVAFSFLSQGKQSITLNKLYEIERRASLNLRKSNPDAILYISKNDIFSTISEYDSLFEIKNQEISFFLDKKDIYKNYFYSGLSKNITDNLASYVLEK